MFTGQRYAREPHVGWNPTTNDYYINIKMANADYKIQFFYFSTTRCQYAQENGQKLLYFAEINAKDIKKFRQILSQFSTDQYKIEGNIFKGNVSVSLPDETFLIRIKNPAENPNIIDALVKNKLLSFDVSQDLKKSFANLPGKYRRPLPNQRS